MHETGLCEAVVEAVLKRAEGRPVSWARVRIGGHPVDPAVITQGIEIAASGTAAEGMAVHVVVDPMRASCRDCGAQAEVSDPRLLCACSACGGVDVEVTGSEEAVLESLAYRSERAADHPPLLTLAAPPVAVYDRFRDRIQGRPRT